MRTDAQILIVERREKREMRNVNAHACSPQRFGQSFSTIFFAVDTFSWHVLCVRAFFASAASIIDQTKVENLKPQLSILYPSFLAYSTPPVDVIAGFSDGQKTKLNQQAKAMCASLQQTTIQYTRFVCMCVCLCGINLSKFVSVH